MEPYILRVTGPEGEVRDDAGVLECFGRLFTEVCRNIVAGELRLQGDVPEPLYADVRPTDDRDLAADARRLTDGALDYLGGPAGGTWMTDTFPDILGRRRIAGLALELSDLLDGRSLEHGPEGSVTAFSDVDRVRLTGMAHSVFRAENGGLMGLVARDPDHRGRWVLSRADGPVPLTFRPTTPTHEIEDYAAAGPVIVTGTVIRDDAGRVTELRTVENCYTFPGAVFLRVIGEGRDLGLSAPLSAEVSYHARIRRWRLECPELGLDSSAPTWDGCVISFHRGFLDLWDRYVGGDGPDGRVRAILSAMHPSYR